MADTDAPPAKSPAKKASKPKPKKPANHPKYCDMIRASIEKLKERHGSSRQSILKCIQADFNVGKDVKVVSQHLKMALRAGVNNGTLKQVKGTGASGSFKVGEKKTKSKKKTVKKPASPKKTTKKPKTKKPAGEKKKKTPTKAKKTKKPKAAAKPKATKPKAKPKAKKTPKKKAAAKKK